MMRTLLTFVLLGGVATNATAQSATALRGTAQSGTAQSGTALSGTALSDTALNDTAQQAPAVTPAGAGGCWPVATREQVVITMNDGARQKGTLLCMGTDDVVLAGSGALPLSSLRQIAKPRDGIADGVFKGAAVGLIVFALCGGECDREYLLRGTVTYAAIGGTIDALQGNNKMIYRRDPRAAAVGWRVRF